MTEETPQSNDRSCRDPYRPYRLPWWAAALALYVIVYWFFGVLVQNVNLLGPVSWIEWINARSLVPLLPQPASPFFRLIINLFNPLVLLHIAGPLMVGLYFAGQTATGFMKEFYGFATQKQAAGFLGRLRAAERQGSSAAAAPTTSRAPAGPMRFLILAAPIAFFGMLALFVAIVEITQPPITSTAQLYYIFLIIFLLVLWVTFIYLSVSITNDYLQRQQHGTGRMARLAGQRLLVYGVLAIVLVAFPALWMAVIYFMLRSGAATAELLFGFLLFIFVATTLTIVVLQLMAPKTYPPVRVTREDFEKLRNENAWLRVGGPGSILVGGGFLAAVTESNGRFCRVLGSGAQRLGAYEYIHSLLDLRQHEREGRQSFVTRDGLQVAMNVAVTFRIASNDAVLESPPAATMPSAQGDNVTRPTTTALFPYGPDAVKMAAYVKTVLDDEGKQINDWQQLPLIIAQGELGKRISALRYDELFAPDQPDQQPHPELLAEVLHAAQFALQRGRTGIHLLNLRLGPVLAVDARMTGEHIMTWRAFWEKQGRVREAQSEARAITEMAEARREAEQMIVSAIIEGIEEAQEQYGEEVTRRIVALRIVDTLGRLANVSQQISAPARAALIQQLEELRDSIDAETQPAPRPEQTTQPNPAEGTA